MSMEVVADVLSSFLTLLSACRRDFGHFSPFLELSFFVNATVFGWRGLAGRYKDKLRNYLATTLQTPVAEVLQTDDANPTPKDKNTAQSTIAEAKRIVDEFDAKTGSRTSMGKLLAIVIMLLIALLLLIVEPGYCLNLWGIVAISLTMIVPGCIVMLGARKIGIDIMNDCKTKFKHLQKEEGLHPAHQHNPLQDRDLIDELEKAMQKILSTSEQPGRNE